LSVYLREELVRLRADYAVDLCRKVDVLAPLLPGGDVLVPEVDAGRRRRVSGDAGIVSRFDASRRASPGPESSHVMRTTIPIEALSDQVFRSKSAN